MTCATPSCSRLWASRPTLRAVANRPKAASAGSRWCAARAASATSTGLQPGQLGDLGDEAHDRLRRVEQGQQCGRARIAIGVQVMAETRRRQAVGEVVGQHLVLARALHLAEQRAHAAGGVAMQRTRRRGQSGQQAGRQTGARRCRDARDKGRAGQFVVGQQDHGRAQQVGHPGRLLPSLGKAQVQRSIARRGAERGGHLPHEPLRFGMQHPGQASRGGMPGRREAGQRGKGRIAARLARTHGRGTREVDGALGAPQQLGRIFERGGARHGHGIAPPVVRPPAEERAQRGRNAGLRSEQRVRGQRLALATGLLALGQHRHVLGAVEPAPRIGRIRRDL